MRTPWKTDKQIPLYEDSNFFSTVTLEIEAYNPNEKFAYPCSDTEDDLVNKYANAKCYGSSDKGVECDGGSCDGHVYNTEFVSIILAYESKTMRLPLSHSNVLLR